MFRAILVYACAACGLAQEVALLPRFQAGDRFRLELTRTREDSRRPGANGTGRTPVDVRMVEAGGAGFLLEWTPGESSIDNPEALRNPIVKQALDSTAGLRFEILPDRQSGFDRIRNEAEGKQETGVHVRGAFGRRVSTQTTYDKAALKDTGAYTFDRSLGLMTAIRVDRDILTGGVLARRENREIRLLSK